MPCLDIRAAKHEDMAFFYPHGMKTTCRAWVFELDGQRAALFGVEIARGCYTAFSSQAKGTDIPKQTKWRMAKVGMEILMFLGYKGLYALVDPNIPGARRFLERLGWECVEQSERGEVMRCPIQ